MDFESQEYRDFINEKVLEYLPAKRTVSGDDVNFRCPFCGDSKKSAIKMRGHYSLRKGVFHCFNCDASASGLKLLQVLAGTSFDEIKEEYVRLRLKNKGIVYTKKSFKEESASSLSALSNLKPIIRESWKVPLSAKANEYLASRMVLDAPFLHEKFYSWTSRDGQEYILIPWIVNSVPCFYQLNDFQKIDKFGRKYIFPSKMEKPVYGLDNIDLGWKKIILFEGVYDSLFVKNGIAIGGKTLTDYQFKMLSERYPKHELVFALDNDEAGLVATERAIENNPSRFKFFKWFGKNTKAKDINEYVLEKNDVNLFVDQKKLDRMIISSLEMKIHLSSFKNLV